MTLKPLDGFTPLTTHHCVTGSMQNIYHYHGYPISEELLLGLGSGVGFVYWHMKGGAPFMGGRANVGRPGEEGMEKTAGRRTGVRIEPCSTGRKKAAEQSLLDLLASGEPVMLQVDMGFLPYFDFAGKFHFGGHVVIAAGVDVGSRQALIADRDGVLHPVGLDALAEARGSKFQPFPPANRWYTFDFSHKHAPEPEEVRQAIREAAIAMLEPPISNLGVKGIRTTAKRIQRWPDLAGGDTLREWCTTAFIFIDATGGTGGGLFRTMYGRFLEEAAAITGGERLAGVAKQMHAVSDAWQKVAGIMQRAGGSPDPAALLPEASARIEDIAGCEQAAWEALHNVVGAAG